ncbi:haloacid dehalogenase type II [Corynebacterium heidelbergense]|uniref:Haloacid dehalogenase type II n=1 Tax=Corynebacterium heidelbergense TaxID=2055947 RepID=A0A364V3Y5_9CORY|nr:haloacid dehalogenase type II [Corynebacterium heidelbergense]RAV31339.1 haloacid dehalogenase type II [Corynebacterium heidelbergense]
MAPSPRLIAIDTFGTLTDWYTGVSEALESLFPSVDASDLTLEWRSAYSPALADVESGHKQWALLDQLHGDSLLDILERRYDVSPSEEQLTKAVEAWHRIPAWPDVVEGVTLLRRMCPVAALSNANVAFLTDIARFNRLEWDFPGGADVWGHYKPSPETYLGIAKMFQCDPSEVLMVATHQEDLDAARVNGLQTAYIERPREYGPLPKAEAVDENNTYHATDLLDLVAQLEKL